MFGKYIAIYALQPNSLRSGRLVGKWAPNGVRGHQNPSRIQQHHISPIWTSGE